MRKRMSSRESLSRSSSQQSDKQQQQPASPPDSARQQEPAVAAAIAAEKGETTIQGTPPATRNNTRDRLLQADSLKAQEHEAARYVFFHCIGHASDSYISFARLRCVFHFFSFPFLVFYSGFLHPLSFYLFCCVFPGVGFFAPSSASSCIGRVYEHGILSIRDALEWFDRM